MISCIDFCLWECEWDKRTTTAKTSQEEMGKEPSLIPILDWTQSFLLCTSWEIYITHNSFEPMSPSQCQEYIIERKKKAQRKSLMKKSTLPPFPSLNTKPFPFLFVPKCTWMFLKSKKLELPAFRRLLAQSCLCESSIWMLQSHACRIRCDDF